MSQFENDMNTPSTCSSRPSSAACSMRPSSAVHGLLIPTIGDSFAVVNYDVQAENESEEQRYTILQ